MSIYLPNCSINLINVGKYMEIDDEVIGIKYKFADLNVMKGKYSTTIYKKAKIKDITKIKKTLFYNQVTIILNNKGNHVNVKLFGNGSLHLTGCKSQDEGIEVTKLLYEKLNKMRDMKDLVLVVKDSNGVWLDKDNLVYSGGKCKKVIGYASEEGKTYVINKKEYEIDKRTGMFICKKLETGRKKPILNLNGEEIGYCKIELTKNQNKFYKRTNGIFYDYNNALIYYNNENIIGRIVYSIPEESAVEIDKEEVNEIVYSCNPFLDAAEERAGIGNIKDIEKNVVADVNCINVYFNIGFAINRTKFYESLVRLNYICKYKPESYSGIKLIYKMPLDIQNFQGSDARQDGHCICTNKCTCRNITFLIFQSGNVIAAGFKDENQIEEICNTFFSLCDQLVVL